MTLPQLRQDLHGTVLPTFGVWCRHEQRWVAVGRFNEKDAFWALLEAASPHPWELVIERIDTREVLQALEDELWAECPARGCTPEKPQPDCSICGGTGEVYEG